MAARTAATIRLVARARVSYYAARVSYYAAHCNAAVAADYARCAAAAANSCKLCLQQLRTK